MALPAISNLRRAAIVMAGGKQTRFKSPPGEEQCKHLLPIPVGGGSVLLIGLTIARLRYTYDKIVVVTDNDRIASYVMDIVDGDVAIIEGAEPCPIEIADSVSNSLCGSIKETRKYWGAQNTTIFLGDVIFSLASLNDIYLFSEGFLSPNRTYEFFGKTHEIFSVSFWSQTYGKLSLSVESVLAAREAKKIKDCKLWHLYRVMQGVSVADDDHEQGKSGNFHHITDWTMDIDYHHQYGEFLDMEVDINDK